jgi:phosphonate degradation associated HDIG domain protein
MSMPPPAWPASTPEAFVDALLAWMVAEGSTHYDEVVTQLDHALQAAYLARRAGDTPDAVAAALLHDVGHLVVRAHERGDEYRFRDLEHEEVGARWLSRMFPASVTEPVRLHVAAKRYLCAVDAAYHDRLSEGSVRSLNLQGGPMSEVEVAQAEQTPHFESAVALRRRDEGAKQPGREVPGAEAYRDVLVDLLRKGEH